MSFVAIVEEEGEEPIEIPSEPDNTLLLSSVAAQFPNVTGLKYRNQDTNAFRGLRIADGKIYPPEEGWEDKIFIAVAPKVDLNAYDNKRKGDDSTENPNAKTQRIERKCSDLIVLGLPWAATEEDLRSCFEQFGELLMAQIKRDPKSGQSKGFGFIRFSDINAQETVLSRRHKVLERWCDVRIPNSKVQENATAFGGPMGQHFIPPGAIHRPGPGGDMGYAYYGYESSQNGGYGQWANTREKEQHNRKVFVGRCTEDMTADDLRSHFSQYGDILDVFIPKPFRAFAFVTFQDAETASRLCGEDHIINGVSVHISSAAPREPNKNRGRMEMQQPPHQGAGWAGGYGPSGKGPHPSMGGGNWAANGAGNGSLSGNNPLGMAGLNIGGFQVNPHALLAAALQQNAMNILGQAMNQQPGAPPGPPPAGQPPAIQQQRPDVQLYQGYGSPGMAPQQAPPPQPAMEADPNRPVAATEFKQSWSGGDAAAQPAASTAGWTGNKPASWN